MPDHDLTQDLDGWFYLAALRQAGSAAWQRWQTSPIGGEIRPELWPCLWKEPGCTEGQDFARCVAETHASWLLDSSTSRPMTSAERNRAEAAARRLGYEFQVVNFRPAPHAIFQAPQGASNRLVINLQPRDGLELHLLAQAQDTRQQPRGSSQLLAPVQLDLDFDKRFGAERVGAYERLLLDVIDGRLNLFVRSDEQEEAWRWVGPLLDAWRHSTEPPRPYAAGSWGPSASSAMIARDGHCWAEEN